MARPTLDQLRGIGDFATLYRWNLSFPQFPSAIVAPGSEDLNLRCESAELPQRTGETIEQMIRGHRTRHPGIYKSVGSLTITFAETVDNTVALFLKSWREACWNVGGTTSGATVPKSELEAIVRLELLDSSDSPRWEYKLIGAFYEDGEGGGVLDGSTSDFLKPTLVLSYDDYTEGPL